VFAPLLLTYVCQYTEPSTVKMEAASSCKMFIPIYLITRLLPPEYQDPHYKSFHATDTELFNRKLFLKVTVLWNAMPCIRVSFTEILKAFSASFFKIEESIMKMEVVLVRSSEMLINIYKNSRSHIPEDRKLHIQRHKIFKHERNFLVFR
jgi:hypothetical protein